MKETMLVNENRVLYIDILRLLVIVGMVVVSVIMYLLHYTPGLATWGLQIVGGMNSLAKFCIPVFFMAVGALLQINDKPLSIGYLYKKYIFNLLLGYFVFAVIYYLVIADADFRISGEMFSVSMYHLYICFHLLGIYVIAPVLTEFSRNATQRVYLYVLGLWALFNIIFPYAIQILPEVLSWNLHVLSSSIANILNIPFAIAYSIGFVVLGQYLHKFPLSGLIRRIVYAAGAIGCLWTVIGTAFLTGQNGAASETLYSVMQPNIVLYSIGVFVFVKYIAEKMAVHNKISGWVTMAAQCTFGVYLIYELFLRLLVQLTGLAASPKLFLPVAIVVVLLLSFAVMLLWRVAKAHVAGILAKFVRYVLRLLEDALGKEDAFDSKVWLQFLHCGITLFAISFIVLVFGPVHISRNSSTLLSEQLLINITLGSAGISFLLAGAVFLLRKKYKFAEIVLTGVLLLCFINATIIPFKATILDGRDLVAVDDNIVPIIQNILLFAIFMIIVALVRKNIRQAAIVMLAFCMAFAVYDMSETKALLKAEAPAVSTTSKSSSVPIKSGQEIIQSSASFSTGKNVIVIGVDMLQGTIAEKTFHEYPELLDMFDGFTIYTRAFSSFPLTMYSRPVINSGMVYSAANTTVVENAIASVQDSFMADMYEQGARVDGYGLNLYNVFPSISTFLSVDKDRYNYGFAAAASVARITGYWPSNPFFNDGVNISLNTVLNSVKANEVLLENFSVGEDTDKLLYIWDSTLHVPLALAKDGSLLSDNSHRLEAFLDETYFEFTQLSRLFTKMKENNVYDNSLIILVSDHGLYSESGYSKDFFSTVSEFSDGYKFNGNTSPASFHNAVLFVKPPNAHGSGVITHDVAWNGDVRALVNYYYENFDNISPVDTIGNLRRENPDVEVLFYDADNTERSDFSSENHETVVVRSLYDIPAAFAEKSGINED